MGTVKTEGGRRKGGRKTNFHIYSQGGTTRDIRLTVNLVIVARRWRSLLDERLRAIGQSAARMEAMGAIINSPSLSAQVDIAKRLRIEGPTMTRMLDTLEADGLVERLPDPADRRTKQLRLTAEGERAAEVTSPLGACYSPRSTSAGSTPATAGYATLFTGRQRH